MLLGSFGEENFFVKCSTSPFARDKCHNMQKIVSYSPPLCPFTNYCQGVVPRDFTKVYSKLPSFYLVHQCYFAQFSILQRVIL